MSTELPGLIVPIEARIDKLEKGLQRANRAQSASAQQMERRAKQSADKINATYGKMTNSIGASFKRMAAPVIAITAFIKAAQQAHKLAEEYRKVENTLRAIGETSDEAAEKLAGAAIRSGADLGDMGQTIMRVQKATNAGFDETTRRVETLNKLLAVGGASTAEANSVSLQLAQALSSGGLQGDELRSLREAAPVELLDAIAKAAGGTRDQLKDMGAQGKLTSDVVLRALDDMAASADADFGKMSMTGARAMTNLNTGLTTFVGRLDEGLGASERLVIGINDLGTFLNENAELAEEFGRSYVALSETARGVFDDAVSALQVMGEEIRNTGIGSVLDLGEAFGNTGLTVGEVLDQIIQGLAAFTGAMEGSADATREAFLKIPDAISGAMQGAINAVIGAVERMINRVLDGVRTVAQEIDTLTAKIPGTDGTNLAGGIGSVSLERVNGMATGYSSRSVGEAYREGSERAGAEVRETAASVEGYFETLQDRFRETRAKLESENAAREAAGGAGGTGGTGSGTGGGTAGGTGSGGGKRGGGGAKEKLDDFTRAAQAIRDETAALQAEAEALAQVTGAQALHGDAMELARTKAELLAAAMRSGLADTPELRAQIDQLAEAYTRAGVDADLAADRIRQVQDASKEGAQAIGNVFERMATRAISAREAVAELIVQIARLIVKKLVLKAIEMAPGAPVSAIPVGSAGPTPATFAQGGYTGPGGTYEPAGIVHKGEFVMSKAATSAIGVDALAGLHSAALKGYSGGGLEVRAGGQRHRSGPRSGWWRRFDHHQRPGDCSGIIRHRRAERRSGKEDGARDGRHAARRRRLGAAKADAPRKSHEQPEALICPCRLSHQVSPPRRARHINRRSASIGLNLATDIQPPARAV